MMKMKVVELKTELEKRGVVLSGLKPSLQDLLVEVMTDIIPSNSTRRQQMLR